MRKLEPDNRKIWQFVTLIFLVWQAAICFLNFVAPYTGIPHQEGYNYAERVVSNPPFFWNWANFDGIHYLDIARKDYGIYQQAFFPFFPRMIRSLTPIFGGKDLIAGVFISNCSLLVALFLLYKLVLLDFNEKVAKYTLLFLMAFPASFFLGMVYTESLFLAWVLGTFYSARKGHWWLAGILGGLASYTRLVGIFLLPALLYEFWQQRKIKNLLPIFLVPVGLLTYMNFLRVRYGDALMFLHVQPNFGAGRSGGKVILLYQVFWRYLKMIMTTTKDPLYFTVWLELITAIFFIWLLILVFKKRFRFSYLIFSVFAFLAPSLSGTFSSLPRYVLILFPCFMVLGKINSPALKKFILVVFCFLFVVSALLFFRGYWIS